MQQDGLYPGIHDLVYVLLFKDCVAVEDLLVTLDGYHFSGIFVDEVLYPGLEHTGGQTAADMFFKSGLAHLHFFRQVENVKDVLVAFVPYST